MMLTNFILSLLLASSVFSVDRAQGQEECECGGPCSYIPFSNMSDALQYYSQCTYLIEKLNVSCVLSSCPMLNATCPFASNGSVNEDALTRTVSILNQCFGETGQLICGVNMTRLPMVQVSWTTAQLIPSIVASGTVAFNLGTGFVDNLSSAKFTVINADNGVITLSIQAPNMAAHSTFNANITTPVDSVVRSVGQLVPTSLYYPHVTGFFPFNVSFTSSIDLSTTAPTIRILNEQSIHQLFFGNFTTPDGKPLLQKAVDFLNLRMNSATKASVHPSTVYNFLSTYFALGLLAAQQNCS